VPSSRIKLIDIASGSLIPAAPENSVLLSSAKLGWHSLTVELHNFAPTELPAHFVDGHRLMVAVQAGRASRLNGEKNHIRSKRFSNPEILVCTLTAN